MTTHRRTFVAALRYCYEITVSPTWQNLIVPFAMKLVAPEVDLCHLLVGNLDPGRIGPVVNLGVDLQPFSCGRSGNQTHDHLQTGERLPAPVLADEREQAVFDLVPFARARRKVAHRDGEPGLVGQRL